MHALFNTIIYTPLYNGLVALLSFVPNGDVGIALIILTIAVKLALSPLAQKGSRTQRVMKEIQPQVDAIRKNETDPRKQMAELQALYKKHEVNPFSMFLLILIQIPVLIGLYVVFSHGGLPAIDSAYLYSFVAVPPTVSMMFLGFLDMTVRSIPLALAVGISQYFYAGVMPNTEPTGEKGSFSHDFGKSMQMQIKYVFPFIIGFVAFSISSGVALYLLVSNLFSIMQELYFKNLRSKIK